MTTPMLNETRRSRTPLRAALFALVPVAALVVAVVATRSTPVASPKPAAHGHGQMTMGDTVKPIMLSPGDAHRIGVTYAVAALADVGREIRTVGQVVVDERRLTTMAPRVEGWVERLHVNFSGQEVAKGEPLLELYSPMLVAAQDEFLLARKLQSDVADGSPQAREQAARLVSSARSRLAQWEFSDADIARLESEGRARRAVTLRAPTSGVVVDLKVMQGQRVMAGDALYTIADLTRVWLEGDVYEQDIVAVRRGQRAEAELQGVPGTVVTGRVAYVYPTLNTETRTVRIRVEIANGRRLLKPGMMATLRLAAAGSHRALTVPRAAVLSTGERHIVFIKRPDGMLEPRGVQIGATSGDRIEILRGLANGDTVVASATFLVDAESSLGTAFGGMGNMPGMDIAAPRKE